VVTAKQQQQSRSRQSKARDEDEIGQEKEQIQQAQEICSASNIKYLFLFAKKKHLRRLVSPPNSGGMLPSRDSLVNFRLSVKHSESCDSNSKVKVQQSRSNQGQGKAKVR